MYTDLHEVIPDLCALGFSFDNYSRGELDIIKPTLESLGYRNIYFIMGERDSFGPLSRIVHCIDKYDGHVAFIYG